MTNTGDLAKQAYDAIQTVFYGIHSMHGIEVAPGFFNIYNETTGQSKTVLLHPESGLLFKNVYEGADTNTENSNRYVGYVMLDDVSYPIRLPYFEVFEITPGEWISAQEYVVGDSCDCDHGWCERAVAIRTASQCQDSHCGNYKIVDGEIVLFDFEGIRIRA